MDNLNINFLIIVIRDAELQTDIVYKTKLKHDSSSLFLFIVVLFATFDIFRNVARSVNRVENVSVFTSAKAGVAVL